MIESIRDVAVPQHRHRQDQEQERCDFGLNFKKRSGFRKRQCRTQANRSMPSDSSLK